LNQIEFKQFNWNKKDILKNNKSHIFIQDSIFDPYVKNIDKFIDAFKLEQKSPLKSNKLIKELIDEKIEHTWFNSQKAQNILITFSKLPSIDKVVEAIKTMDDKVLNTECLSNLLTVLKTEDIEEFRNLFLDHKQNPDKL